MSGADAEGEKGVLEEWEAAATAARCPNVDAMLQELSVRVAAVEVVSSLCGSVLQFCFFERRGSL